MPQQIPGVNVLRYFSRHYLGLIWTDFLRLGQGNSNGQVSFLICGAQKSGTTALDTYLREHPDICMAKYKEVHFFDREKYFLHPAVNYRHYHSFFNPEYSTQIQGETTPSYMYWYAAPRRIWEYNPDMKLVIILRNPIERAFSHWNMQRERGVEKLKFMDALSAEENRRYASRPLQNKRFSYLDRGFYSEQIRRLRAFFPANQVLILRNQTLRHSPETVLKKIAEYLNINPFPKIKFSTIHTRSYVSQMTEKEWNFLFDHLQMEIKEVEKLTGWNCQDWCNFSPETN